MERMYYINVKYGLGSVEEVNAINRLQENGFHMRIYNPITLCDYTEDFMNDRLTEETDRLVVSLTLNTDDFLECREKSVMVFSQCIIPLDFKSGQVFGPSP